MKYELQTVPGVSEVATLGNGQAVPGGGRPQPFEAYGIPLSHIQMAIKRANQETGASVVEMAEAEYMVRVTGYLKSTEDLEKVPLGVNDNGVPLLLRDVASVELGPQMRRGFAGASMAKAKWSAA